MEDNKKLLENILYTIAFFLCAFLFTYLEFLGAKVITNQFMGSIQAFSYTFIFSIFTILLGILTAHFIKKMPARFQIMVSTLLFLATLITFKIPVELVSPFDFFGLNTFLMFSIMLFKFMFLPFLTLITIFNILPSWYSEDCTQTAKTIGFWGFILPMVLYPMVYEKSLSTIQNYKVAYIALGILFVTFFVISILFTFKTQDLIHTKTESVKFNKKELLVSIIYGIFTGSILMCAINYININSLSMPLMWGSVLSVFLIAIFARLNNFKFANRKWSLTFAYLLLLLFVLFEVTNMTFQKNPLIFYLTTLTSLFVFTDFVFGEFVRIKEKFEAKNISNYIFILGFFAGTILVNSILPLIFKTQIEHTIILAFIYIFAAIIFITSFVKNINLEHGEKEHAMLLVSLTVILIFAFFRIESLGLYSKKYVRNFNSMYAVKVDRGTGIKMLLNNNRTIAIQGFDNQKQKYDTLPTGFYGGYSGFALLLSELKNINKSIKMAVIGTGAGTVASYLNEGDKLAFFEVNPKIKEAIDDNFSFIKETKAKTHFVIGNPRITLNDLPYQGFDAILVDLTANKNNPSMLITSEAIDLYLKQLKPDAALIFNISRKNLDFVKVLKKYADDKKLDYSYILTKYPKRFVGNFNSQFFVIYMPKSKLQKNIKKVNYKNNNGVTIKDIDLTDVKTPKRQFTDNFSSLVPIMTPGLLYK